jgi:predicted dehydrogenase
MADLVNLGVVGCGGNALWHMETLGQMDAVRIVAVCDVAPNPARHAAARFWAEAYLDIEQMLERNDLHGVYLCLPTFAHGDPELAVIRRGSPFFVEKPVARTMDVARRVQTEVQRKQIIACVGYQLRSQSGCWMVNRSRWP